MKDFPEETAGLHIYDKIVAALNKHHVEFLIVGGFAVIYHGHVRATEDMDVFIRATEVNAKRVVAALKEVSLGEIDLPPDVFTKGKGVSIGQRPLQVDILSDFPGVAFDEAWTRRETDLFGPATVNYISRDHLIINKRAAGRPVDIDDARELEAGRGHANKSDKDNPPD